MKSTGFSLVELSIVLVILGLLTGGILGGQSLIKAAELRSVGEEYKWWQIAINTFKQKYSALPGDMVNATDFWPSDTSDGDGNGRVRDGTSGDEPEAFLFWQHLALAGVITGEYTGAAEPGSAYDSLAGTNVPSSKYNGGGWGVLHWTPPNYNEFVLDYGQVLFLGASVSPIEYLHPLFTPEDIWNIDMKFDDGQPAKGSVIAMPHISSTDTCTTATSTSDYDAEYELENDGVACALMMRNAF